MRKFIFLGLIFSLMSTLATAQYEGAKDGWAFRWMGVDYKYPITQVFDWNNFGKMGMEVEYSRHLNKAMNLAIPLRIAGVDYPADPEGSSYIKSGLIGLDATVQFKLFKESSFIYPYVFAGAGLNYEGLEGFAGDIPVGAGINFRLGHHFYLTTKGAYRFGLPEGRDNLQLGAGLMLLLGDGVTDKPEVSDRDMDGIPDNEDLCPDVAGLLGLNGCPDTDGDGIADGQDNCPDVAGVKALMGCPDRDGDGVADAKDACPDIPGLKDNAGCPVVDGDGDGIADDEDACPGLPGTAATDGCPDLDGDGIADKDDSCPNVAGPAASNGCPDSDNDGVVDSKDKCPDSYGTAENNGCPEIAQEDKDVLELAVEAVQFETARAVLKTSSYDILNQIVGLLKKYPNYKLNISGYTDTVGSSGENLKLSERRAKACFDYLVNKGISPARLAYKGYGETRKFGDNRYKDGRAKNRRVVFDLFVE